MKITDKAQLEKAVLEDVLMELLYTRYPDLVFHGGTAIWRCYGGNRYSRDLDFYYKPGSAGEDSYKELIKFFKEAGFAMKGKSYNRETRTMQFLVEGSTKMKVDLNLGYKKGTAAEYTKVDGSKTVVVSLTPEELLNEKMDAYEDKLRSKDQKKQPEAHDLYDIYFLTGIIENGSAASRKRTGALLKEIGDRQPEDIGSLGHLMLSGIAPTFELMVEKIDKWSK
ncbi:MAG: nucleotidyl transferase AbiEii/AbiGii toxin family protein [Candidatus Micrarchaeota archaeon]|nr:nucleotidyl transferase AbiEii/AbiGii toxin family protein [Candidatus Micrarchaeota archaeon]MDE1848401.1 nucleotidyl transferase AbiEii/AbiGii toxin family protein [Candidatus Micrarchaeota archaeon]